MAQVLGIISSLLGIVSFGINNMPKHVEQKTTIRIGVGLDTEGGLYSAGGDLPDVRAWAEGGEFLGISADPGTIDDGNFYDVVIEQGDNSQQAPYLLLSANEDGICVAYTSTTWADGSHYGWVGDWGQACGGSWYYSNLFWHDKDYKPLCTWLGSSPQTGISMHLPSFNTKDDQVPEDVSTTDFCTNAGIFQIHTEEDPGEITFLPIEGTEPPTTTGAVPTPTVKAKSKAKRSNKRTPRRAANHDDKLVISDDAANHLTRKLCESEGSLGPDFANTAEALFCRMSDKTIWDFCAGNKTTECFDVESHQVLTEGVGKRETKYAKVMDWTSGN